MSTPAEETPGLKAVFRSSEIPATWAPPYTYVPGTAQCIMITPEYALGSDRVANIVVDVTDQSLDEAADLLAAIAESLRAIAGRAVPLEPTV